MYETIIQLNERIRPDSAESPYQVTAWVAYFSVDTYVGFFRVKHESHFVGVCMFVNTWNECFHMFSCVCNFFSSETFATQVAGRFLYFCGFFSRISKIYESHVGLFSYVCIHMKRPFLCLAWFQYVFTITERNLSGWLANFYCQ